MKRLVVLGVIASLAASLATSVSADIDTNWMVLLRAENAARGANGYLSCGTNLGSSDAYKFGEDAIQSTGSGARAFISSDLDLNKIIAKDSRVPLSYGETKIWNLSVWQIDATGLKTSGTITILGWVYPIYGMDIGSGTRVELVGPWTEGRSDYIFPNDTVTPESKGTATSPLFTRTLEYDGVNDVHLQLIATAAVPEPASIVALISGLASIGGFAWRRRK